MGKLWIWIALAIVQPANDELLNRLTGTWTGEGVVLNQPSEVELRWEPTLDGRFYRLQFVNIMAGKTRFEGHAYYRALGGGRYRGSWFDNSGAIRPIEATRDGDALVAQWGTPETEVGETTYRLDADGALVISDRIKGKNGEWRPFGKLRLIRK